MSKLVCVLNASNAILLNDVYKYSDNGYVDIYLIASSSCFHPDLLTK